MKRLQISTSSFDLNIAYRWRSAVAYFLVFFCLFWDGFLVIWYGLGMSSNGEMPMVFFLFPLIHVAVGIGLTYDTICLFLNTTYIEVDQQMIRVHHGPLPWPRGNKSLPVRELDQLYVKERTGNKGSKYYTLEMRTIDGEDVSLIGQINATTDELQHLERTIENYLGIIDRPMGNEFHRKQPPLTTASEPEEKLLRRREPSPGYSARAGVEVAKVGSFVTYERRTFEVSHESLYQWNNGNTDRLLQLAAVDGTQMLLYIKQDKGLFETYLEIRFTQAQQAALGFTAPPAPHEITYDRVTYELDEQAVGQEYLSHTPQKGIAAKEWLYRTKAGDEYLRILDHKGMTTVYFGQREIAGAFDVL